MKKFKDYTRQYKLQSTSEHNVPAKVALEAVISMLDDLAEEINKLQNNNNNNL